MENELMTLKKKKKTTTTKKKKKKKKKKKWMRSNDRETGSEEIDVLFSNLG